MLPQYIQIGSGTGANRLALCCAWTLLLLLWSPPACQQRKSVLSCALDSKLRENCREGMLDVVAAFAVWSMAQSSAASSCVVHGPRCLLLNSIRPACREVPVLPCALVSKLANPAKRACWMWLQILQHGPWHSCQNRKPLERAWTLLSFWTDI
jgi:hypothetical protein